MAQRLEFWFEFASTYSYPAAERVRRLLESGAAEIVYRPFMLGPIFKKQGLSDSPFNLNADKGRHMWRDLERRCGRLGIPFERPDVFPQNGLLGARVCMALGSHALLPRFVCDLYRENFVHGHDISDAAVVGSVLEGLGLPAAELLARASETQTRDALRALGSEAAERGIFGAPSFVADCELFWGEDRLQDALCMVDVPTSVEGLRIRPAAPADTDAIVELWRGAGLLAPHNDPLSDIATKRAQQPESFLVAERRAELVGVCMGGHDGHRGWLNYLAVEGGQRRAGVGRALVDAVEARLRAAGCPKVNLQVRADNALVAGFYEQLGYAVEERLNMGKRL